MAAETVSGFRRGDGRTPLPAELERALRNCNAALQSLGAAEARVSRQLAAIQADRAVLARRPFAPLDGTEDRPAGT